MFKSKQFSAYFPANLQTDQFTNKPWTFPLEYSYGIRMITKGKK